MFAAAVVGLLVLPSSGRLGPRVDRARAADPGPPLTVTVGKPLEAQRIPAGFEGLSIEYRALEEYAGEDPHAVNPLLLRLIAQLSPHHRPELRIGGDSTDRAWWPARHVREPRGAYIKLTRLWLADARAVIRRLDARVILGINFEADSPTTARAEARALTHGIGRHWVQALELGNEPELYNTFTWWHTALGQARSGRPASYDFPTYLPDYARVSSALPGVPLAGPSVGSARWMADVSQFIAAEPQVRIVTVHRYPLQLCYKPPRSPAYPTIAHLLSAAASTGLADSVLPDVRAAHAAGLKIRVDEINTISCGQAPQVGKSFASALWALQTLFAFARTGVDGVNFHTYVGSPYALFRFHQRHGVWSTRVYPEYYGMLMFAHAAPPGSRLLKAAGAERHGVHTWATRGPGRLVRVTLINDGARSHAVSIRLRHGASVATVERLTAPTLTAYTDVTLDGQGISSTTGGLAGPADSEQVTRHRGAYTLELGAGSAALLTVRVGR